MSPPDRSAGRDPRRRPGRALRWLAILLALAFAGAQIHGPIAVLDNLSNFPAHFGAAFLALAAVFGLRRQLVPALACLALTVLALWRVVPWYIDAPSAPENPARPYVRLLVSNVYFADAAPFDSGGTQNTTWSILAMCWRTMDHLKERLKKGEV